MRHMREGTGTTGEGYREAMFPGKTRSHGNAEIHGLRF